MILVAQYTTALTKVFFLSFLIQDPQFLTIDVHIQPVDVLCETLKFPIIDP